MKYLPFTIYLFLMSFSTAPIKYSTGPLVFAIFMLIIAKLLIMVIKKPCDYYHDSNEDLNE